MNIDINVITNSNMLCAKVINQVEKQHEKIFRMRWVCDLSRRTREDFDI